MTTISPEVERQVRRPRRTLNDRRDFERRYRTEEEPWRFGHRAAELLRHEWVVDVARELSPDQLLDVGCSLGQLTTRLTTLDAELHAVDISPTAVHRARTLLDGRADVRFAAGSATSLPYSEGAFDFVLACDGLYSWELDCHERRDAIAEIHRVLRIGGHSLFTEHTRPDRFDEFIGEIVDGGFRVVAIQYLYDRPWYQFESWFRWLRGWPVTQQVLRSLGFARALQAIGRALGPRASRHVCVLAIR